MAVDADGGVGVGGEGFREPRTANSILKRAVTPRTSSKRSEKNMKTSKLPLLLRQP